MTLTLTSRVHTWTHRPHPTSFLSALKVHCLAYASSQASPVSYIFLCAQSWRRPPRTLLPGGSRGWNWALYGSERPYIGIKGPHGSERAQAGIKASMNVKDPQRWILSIVGVKNFSLPTFKVMALPLNVYYSTIVFPQIKLAKICFLELNGIESNEWGKW